MKKRKRMIIKTIAVLILLTGVSLVAYTAYEYKSGEKESEQLIEDFYERIEDKNDEQEKEEVSIPSGEQTSAEEETTRPSFEEGIIGIIEIESIGIR